MPNAIKNPEDILGQKFGHLVVESYLGRRAQKRESVPIYQCRCDCGNVVEATRWVLLKGEKISCGCAKKLAGLRRKEDLTGQQFGRWTVLGPAETRYSPSGKTRRIMWKCQCGCGAIRDVGARALKTGMSTSCGCYQKELVSSYAVDDLTNRRFGNAVVLRRSTVKQENRRSVNAIWHCRCDCGNEFDTFGFSLKNGDTTSCGCRKSSRYEDFVEEYLQNCGYVKEKDYFREKTFPGLIGIGGGLLRVDFFVHLENGLDVIIECQGEQHYRAADWYGGQEYLHKVQVHDKRKKQYAESHHIQLIEVFPKDITYDAVVERLQMSGIGCRT